MRPVRVATFLFSVLLVFGPVLSLPASGQAPARTVAEAVPLSASGTVTVDNHEGSITVTPWDRDQVRYEAEIMPTDEAPNAENVTIQVRAENDRLRLATEHDEGDDESVLFGFGEEGFQWGGIDIPAVHYTIRMPRGAALQIDDHESTIDVTGLGGRLEIDTHEGPVTVREQRGGLFIDSHESALSITDQAGDVTLKTHDGRIEIRRMTGRLSVDTHESEVVVEGLDGGFRVESHDGSARVSFAALSDDVFADTHDGDVALTLPTGVGFDLDTDFDDDVDWRSDMDLRSIRIADEDDEDVNYRGDVNGGGPMIRLESDDGDFALRVR